MRAAATKAGQLEAAEQILKDCEDKLVHQATLHLLDFCRAAQAPPQIPEMVDFYKSFVKPMAPNMNPMSITQIASLVADHIADSSAALKKNFPKKIFG